ncbi:NlpC/P60 family protein [Specibacter sp. NPDC057265]|uniref:NlpC/P60 family protein n=1 Tax=Specibacter sp. NPDC057265 TaxID=3346075 RepID=UPI00362B4501
MASNIALGRHRAEVVKTSPISTLTKAVSSNVGGVGRQAAVIAAASGLVLTSGIAANASTPTVERASDGATTLNLNTGLAPTITAASTVKIAFATPAITSTPAPVVEAPVVVEAQSQTLSNNEVAPVAAAAVQPAATAAAAPAAAPAAAVSVEAPAPTKTVVQSGIGATIASAALAQIGVAQDCTRLASNALAAAGINHHGWPASYLSLGRTVSAGEAQPGDLIYYADGGMGMAHIAVYIGNGQAVHGGWGGGMTAVFSANVGSGPVFIAMGH